MLVGKVGAGLQTLGKAIFSPRSAPLRTFISATTGESFNYPREASPFLKRPTEVSTLPYFVRRTKFLSLPVYTEYRNAGTRLLTVIRRIQGCPQQLIADLQASFPEWKISFNKTNQHVVVKGLRHHEVRDWLTAKGF